MYVTITKLVLKTPFHFFALAKHALSVKKQLRDSNCVRSRFTGIGMTHYTMSLWRTKDDMDAFSKTGAHLDSMKQSHKFAKDIVVLTIDSTNVIPWKEAKALLSRSGTFVKKR